MKNPRNYLALVLVVVLAVLGWQYVKLSDDFMRLCVETGPHDANVPRGKRNTIARLCLKRGWTGDVPSIPPPQ